MPPPPLPCPPPAFSLVRHMVPHGAESYRPCENSAPSKASLHQARNWLTTIHLGRRSEDSDGEELEVDLGEEWQPGCEHLFDLHSFYDGLSSLNTPAAASPCQSASWHGAALIGGSMHEWLQSAEVAGRDANPRGGWRRSGASWHVPGTTPLQRTCSRISSDDIFVRLSA